MTPDDFGLQSREGKDKASSSTTTTTTTTTAGTGMGDVGPAAKRRKTPTPTQMQTKSPSPAGRFAKPRTPAIAPAAAPGVNVMVCAVPAGQAKEGGTQDRLESWLAHVQVLTGSKPNKIVEVQAHDVVAGAFQTLISARILSAPVYDTYTESYVGVIDFVDLVHLAVESLSSVSSRVSLDHLMHHSAFTHRVFQLANSDSLSPFVAVKLGSSIVKVMQGLAMDKLHRICITDPAGRVKGIISQSWMVKWLHSNAQRFLGDSVDAPISSFGLDAPKTIVTIRDSQLAIEAFSTMIDACVSAVGIVDSHNVLKSVISVRDIKAVRPSSSDPDLFHFDALYTNVMEFVTASRAMNDTETVPILSCHPDTPLSTVLGRVVAARMHRIFVVDANHHPISVISLSDLISLFLPASARHSLVSEATAASTHCTITTTKTSTTPTTTVASISITTTSASAAPAAPAAPSVPMDLATPTLPTIAAVPVAPAPPSSSSAPPPSSS